MRYMSPNSRQRMAEDMYRTAALNYDKFYTYPKMLQDMKCDIHPTYAQKLFRDYSGVTLREYLTRIRLNVAMHLLLEGTKVDAVAVLVGYRSKKNFYRRFRESFGTSPTCWRAQNEH